jgi:hypothetical protein
VRELLLVHVLPRLHEHLLVLLLLLNAYVWVLTVGYTTCHLVRIHIHIFDDIRIVNCEAVLPLL